MYSGVGLWYGNLPNAEFVVQCGDDWQLNMRHLCSIPQDRNVSWRMWTIQIVITVSCDDSSFVATGGSTDCYHTDNKGCRHLRKTWHHNNSAFSKNMGHHTYTIMVPMVTFMATIVHRTDCWLRVHWVLHLLLLLYIRNVFVVLVSAELFSPVCNTKITFNQRFWATLRIKHI